MKDYEIVAKYNRMVKAYCAAQRRCSDCTFASDTNCRKYEPDEEQYEAVMNPPVDWSKVSVDTKILVRNGKKDQWINRRFAEYKNGFVYAFICGASSSQNKLYDTVPWRYAKLAEEAGTEANNG